MARLLRAVMIVIVTPGAPGWQGVGKRHALARHKPCTTLGMHVLTAYDMLTRGPSCRASRLPRQVDRCSFTNSSTLGPGGAIFLGFYTVASSITRSTFNGTRAAGPGGAITLITSANKRVGAH